MFQNTLDIGSLHISWVSLFFLLGVVIAYFLVGKTARSASLPLKPLRAFIICCIPIAYIGQRLVWIIYDWHYYLDHPGEIILGNGGMFYGGFILCFLFMVYYTRKKKLPFYKTSDSLYPMMIAQVLGRLGCLFDGCCFGNPTTVPWGIPSSYSMILHSHGVDNILIHPTQLYHVAADAILLIILHWTFRHKRFDGQVFVLYLAGYAISRFIIEFYRYDFELGLNVYGTLSINQLISIFVFLGAVCIWLNRRNHDKTRINKN